MILLSIDPGCEKSAWVLYNTDSPEPIINMGIQENEVLIRKFFEEDFDQGFVDEVVIEMIASYGMAVGASVFETCVMIGRLVQLFSKLPVSMMYRKDVKMHLCQSMRAKDANIRQALIDKLGPPGTKRNPGGTYGVKADMWSALAVAVCFSETVNLQKKGETL